MSRHNPPRRQPEVFHSQDLTESCGTVLVDHVTRSICLLHDRYTHQTVLPKGRRDTFESRQDAAVRETREETGYACQLATIDMLTRTTAPGGGTHAPHRPRAMRGAGEPISMIMIPHGGGQAKLVWYFLAETTREYYGRGPGDKDYYGPCQEVGAGEARYEVR